MTINFRQPGCKLSACSAKAAIDLVMSLRWWNVLQQRLQELQGLKDKGLVTQDEYDARRQEILRSI